jgi:hypothetical protein
VRLYGYSVDAGAYDEMLDPIPRLHREQLDYQQEQQRQ